MKVVENNDLWRKPVLILPFQQVFGKDTSKTYFEKKVIISEDREHLFGIMPAKTPVLKHEEAFEVFTNTITRLWGQGDPEFTVTSLNVGGTMQVMAEMPQYEVRLNKNDVSHLRAYLENAYIPRANLFKVHIGGFRHECENSMIFGNIFRGATAREMAENWSVTGMETLLERELSRAIDVQEYWKVFAEHEIDYESAQEMVKGRIKTNMLGNVMLEETFPKTVWEFYNSLTSELTHGFYSAGERWMAQQRLGSMFYNRTGAIRKIPAMNDITKQLQAVDRAIQRKRAGVAEELKEAA